MCVHRAPVERVKTGIEKHQEEVERIAREATEQAERERKAPMYAKLRELESKRDAINAEIQFIHRELGMFQYRPYAEQGMYGSLQGMAMSQGWGSGGLGPYSGAGLLGSLLGGLSSY